MNSRDARNVLSREPTHFGSVFLKFKGMMNDLQQISYRGGNKMFSLVEESETRGYNLNIQSSQLDKGV